MNDEKEDLNNDHVGDMHDLTSWRIEMTALPQRIDTAYRMSDTPQKSYM